MQLFTYETTLPYAIEDVFALTVDLSNAPYWHDIFTDVQHLTTTPIGSGSRWKMIFTPLSFDLEIIEYQPPCRVVFQGSQIMGMIPNFTIVLDPVPDGTRIHYTLHPDVPLLIKPVMKLFAPPYGRRDLNRYFRELDVMLAAL